MSGLLAGVGQDGKGGSWAWDEDGSSYGPDEKEIWEQLLTRKQKKRRQGRCTFWDAMQALENSNGTFASMDVSGV